MVVDDQRVRIGELSRRTGVAPDLLRAWERRYGLLSPTRTAGGFRLYGPDDVERVRRMTEAIASGLPASMAAQRALRDSDARGGLPAPPPGALVDDLDRAVAAFDEVAVNAVFDRGLAALTVESLLADVVMPFLQRLGAGWEAGLVSIAQEHFATGIVRGRLLGLARGWGAGSGRVALLACPPREQHDLGLIAMGLLLRQHGWRIVMLGPNTPIATVAESADRVSPDLIVVSSMQPEFLDATRAELVSLAARHRVAMAGPGATAALARDTGIWRIEGSPAAAAAAVVGAPAPG